MPANANLTLTFIPSPGLTVHLTATADTDTLAVSLGLTLIQIARRLDPLGVRFVDPNGEASPDYLTHVPAIAPFVIEREDNTLKVQWKQAFKLNRLPPEEDVRAAFASDPNCTIIFKDDENVKRLEARAPLTLIL